MNARNEATTTQDPHRARLSRFRVACIVFFLMGVLFTNPSFMYISLGCATFLLLQTRDKMGMVLGVILIGLQVLAVAIFLDLTLHAYSQSF